MDGSIVFGTFFTSVVTVVPSALGMALAGGGPGGCFGAGVDGGAAYACHGSFSCAGVAT